MRGQALSMHDLGRIFLIQTGKALTGFEGCIVLGLEFLNLQCTRHVSKHRRASANHKTTMTMTMTMTFLGKETSFNTMST